MVVVDFGRFRLAGVGMKRAPPEPLHNVCRSGKCWCFNGRKAHPEGACDGVRSEMARLNPLRFPLGHQGGGPFGFCA